MNLGGSLFDSLGKALAKQVMPEDVVEGAAKTGAEAAGEVVPKLPDYVLQGGAPTPPPRVRVPTPEPQPLAPTTRVQQLDPAHAEIAAHMETSPGYLDRLDDLGAGRQVTHDETWAKALNAKPMTIDELSNWPAGKPVNEVHVARAGLLRRQLWDQYFDAMKNEDDNTAMELEKAIQQIEPGYNALTATPGRATEFQKVFQENDAIQNRVRQLREIGVPFPQVRDEINGMVQDMADRNKDQKDPELRSLLQKVEDYATSAKLSSPVTWENKGLTDGITYLQRGVEQHIQAAIAQMGGRPEDAEALRTYAFGTSQGFKDGWRKFLDAFDPTKTTRGTLFDKPVGKTNYAISIPFRVLSGVTNLWHAVIYDSEVNTRAYAAARKIAGDDPTALAAALQTVKAKMPEDWKMDALRTANEYTFQEDPDRLLRFLQKGQNVPGMRFFIPIVKIPYNITRFSVRRSPLGLLSPKYIKALRAGGPERAQTVARLGLGIGLYGLAASLVAHGDVNGAIPQDPRERALWDAEGRQPFSMRVNGDTMNKAHWLKFNRVGPVGMLLSMAAGVHDAMRQNDFDKAQQLESGLMEHVMGMTKRLTYQGSEGALDIPFVEDLKTLLDALLEPDKKLDALTRAASTGFVPNFLRDVRNQVDPEIRKPTNVTEAIENMIPGLSGQVTPKYTVIGTKEESETDRVTRAFKTVSPSLEDENTQFLREIGWAPMPPPTTLRAQGEQKKLDTANRESYMKEMGEATLAAVQACMKDPRIAPLDPVMKRKVVSRVVEAARKPVLRKYQILLGLYGPEAQQEVQQRGQP